MIKTTLSLLALAITTVSHAQVTATIPPPQNKCDLNNPGDMIEIFNLRDSEQDIIGDQTNVVVTYHETSGDALGNGIVISNPESYTNISPEQVIFVRVENENNPSDSEITTLNIAVRQPPVPDNPNPDPLVEDPTTGDGDGIATFDLTDIESELTFDPFVVDFTYHLTESDADEGINAIDMPENFMNTENPQNIFVRMQNAPEEECSTIVPFQVVADDDTLSLENKDATTLTLHPNPSVSEIYVLGNTAFAKVSLYAVTGTLIKTIEHAENTTLSIDVSTLSAGVYFLQVDDNTIKRFIKK